MRSMRGLACAFIPLAAGAVATSALAAPEIVHYQGAVGAAWNYAGGSAGSAQAGLQQTSETKADASPLLDGWNFYESASSESPDGTSLDLNSYASGWAELDVNLNEDGFGAYGYVEGYQYYDSSDAALITQIGGNGGATFRFNVQIPDAGPDYFFALEGSGEVPSGAGFLRVRLTEFGTTNTITDIVKYDEDDALYPDFENGFFADLTADVNTYVLQHGKQYEFYVNAQIDPSLTYADLGLSDFADSSSFELIGSFTAVPEPTIAFSALGLGLVGLLRKRAKVTQ